MGGMGKRRFDGALSALLESRVGALLVRAFFLTAKGTDFAISLVLRHPPIA